MKSLFQAHPPENIYTLSHVKTVSSCYKWSFQTLTMKTVDNETRKSKSTASVIEPKHPALSSQYRVGLQRYSSHRQIDFGISGKDHRSMNKWEAWLLIMQRKSLCNEWEFFPFLVCLISFWGFLKWLNHSPRYIIHKLLYSIYYIKILYIL